MLDQCVITSTSPPAAPPVKLTVHSNMHNQKVLLLLHTKEEIPSGQTCLKIIFACVFMTWGSDKPWVTLQIDSYLYLSVFYSCSDPHSFLTSSLSRIPQIPHFLSHSSLSTTSFCTTSAKGHKCEGVASGQWEWLRAQRPVVVVVVLLLLVELCKVEDGDAEKNVGNKSRQKEKCHYYPDRALEKDSIPLRKRWKYPQGDKICRLITSNLLALNSCYEDATSLFKAEIKKN